MAAAGRPRGAHPEPRRVRRRVTISAHETLATKSSAARKSRRRDSTVTENEKSGVAVRKNPEGRPLWGERQRSPHFLRQLDGT
jgi:hypothetical protein